ncbi:hypothetical protein C8Q72DRAFT_946947 [Fomitopsis betulina]|nr:hypothetical protein C8Q72DRAFT_946947 [Fomitopsis betulina]
MSPRVWFRSRGQLAAKYTSKQLLDLRLDVTKPAEITAAFDEAAKAYGRIDVVYNNAGYAVLGEFEATTEQTARAIFDVNFFGAVNVTKEAVRAFRDVKKPQGALDSISDTLASELDPEWNIKILEVESGTFNTNAKQNVFRTKDHPAYSKPTLAANQTKTSLVGDSFPPETPLASAAVEAIYKLSEVEEPPRHLPLGNGAVQLEVAHSRSAELLENARKVASWSGCLR